MWTVWLILTLILCYIASKIGKEVERIQRHGEVKNRIKERRHKERLYRGRIIRGLWDVIAERESRG